jgi:hypothetical protein
MTAYQRWEFKRRCSNSMPPDLATLYLTGSVFQSERSVSYLRPLSFTSNERCGQMVGTHFSSSQQVSNFCSETGYSQVFHWFTKFFTGSLISSMKIWHSYTLKWFTTTSISSVHHSYSRIVIRLHITNAMVINVKRRRIVNFLQAQWWRRMTYRVQHEALHFIYVLADDLSHRMSVMYRSCQSSFPPPLAALLVR